MRCILNSDITGLEALLKQGVDINSTDYDFRTPLHIAAVKGNLEIFKFLLENGATMQIDRFVLFFYYFFLLFFFFNLFIICYTKGGLPI